MQQCVFCTSSSEFMLRFKSKWVFRLCLNTIKETATRLSMSSSDAEWDPLSETLVEFLWTPAVFQSSMAAVSLFSLVRKFLSSAGLRPVKVEVMVEKKSFRTPQTLDPGLFPQNISQQVDLQQWKYPTQCVLTVVMHTKPKNKSKIERCRNIWASLFAYFFLPEHLKYISVIWNVLEIKECLRLLDNRNIIRCFSFKGTFVQLSVFLSLSALSEFGLLMKSCIDQGQLVPDDVISRLILSDLRGLGQSSWLLDGGSVHQHKHLSRIYSSWI